MNGLCQPPRNGKSRGAQTAPPLRSLGMLGRPPLPDDERRSQTLRARVSPPDLQRCLQAAEACDLTLSEWLRSLALRAAHRHRRKPKPRSVD